MSDLPATVECDLCGRRRTVTQEDVQDTPHRIDDVLHEEGWLGGPSSPRAACPGCTGAEEYSYFVISEAEDVDDRGFHDEEDLVTWLMDRTDELGTDPFRDVEVVVYQGTWKDPREPDRSDYEGWIPALEVLMWLGAPDNKLREFRT